MFATLGSSTLSSPCFPGGALASGTAAAGMLRWRECCGSEASVSSRGCCAVASAASASGVECGEKSGDWERAEVVESTIVRQTVKHGRFEV